jgi:peptidoglycan/LPS O-acetylase OafA/YrhL
MSLPFTQEQFLQVMQRYNEALWPAPVALNALALAAVAALGIRRPGRHAFIAGVLALLWAWSAVCYHFLYFYEINPAAALFGAMFLAAAALFGWQGVFEQRLRFAPRAEPRTFMGAALVAYALIGYPFRPPLSGDADLRPAMPDDDLHLRHACVPQAAVPEVSPARRCSSLAWSRTWASCRPGWSAFGSRGAPRKE